MSVAIIPYILVIMIFYDLSLHVFDLLHVYGKTKMKHPIGAYLIFDYLSKGNKQKWSRAYEVFWTTYWGLGFTLLMIYILSL